MSSIDRYLVHVYAKTLVVAFVSLVGLYVVIDGFNNLDEFLTYGNHRALETAKVLAEYYTPRLLQFFDMIAGPLAMFAAVFVLTGISRSNELTALLAAGIAPSRVIRPLIAASVVVTALAIANREMGLPSVRDSLSRNAQDWRGETDKRCTPRYDLRTDILISAKSTFANQKRLTAPLFQLPELTTWGRQIAAESANYLPATAEHPAGYLLRQVKQPVNLGQLASISLGGNPVLFSPLDTHWLAPGECFVVSVVTFEQLSVGSAWRQNLSTLELMAGLRGHTIEPGADVRLTLHSRLIRPLLDLSLVLMGIPLVLSRASRNIFLAAAVGFGLVLAMHTVNVACDTLGKNYLLSATLAAWLPLLIFGPLAYSFARPLWD